MEGIIQTGNQVRNMAGRKKDPLYKSFGYAFQGIFTCIRKERNMKIHCTVAVLVVIAGLILGISVTEWCICLGLFGMVMALELVNTAVEAVVDLVTEERHPLAKIAKDNGQDYEEGVMAADTLNKNIDALDNGRRAGESAKGHAGYEPEPMEKVDEELAALEVLGSRPARRRIPKAA